MYDDVIHVIRQYTPIYADIRRYTRPSIPVGSRKIPLCGSRGGYVFFSERKVTPGAEPCLHIVNCGIPRHPRQATWPSIARRSHPMVRNSQTWQSSTGCEGLGCVGLSVMIVAIIVIVGVAFAATLACCVLSVVRRRRAFRKGVVPAGLLLGGAQRHSKNAGSETIDGYVLKMKRIPVRGACAGNGGVVVREESCPVCLKAAADIKTLVELGCAHQLCEPCMNKIVRADRLHARCPLCRVYLLAEKEGVESCCRGPVPGEVQGAVEMGRIREPEDASRRVEFGGGDRSRWMVV